MLKKEKEMQGELVGVSFGFREDLAARVTLATLFEENALFVTSIGTTMG